MRSTMALVLLPLTLMACTSATPDPKTPRLDRGWNEILPGGGTTCARGTEWGFYVRPGTVNKLVVDFFGGGACWDEGTCGLAGGIFTDSMDEIRSYMEMGVADYWGIYDRENEANPFKDWYHLVLPYCTGDVHWGDSIKEYGTGADAFTIYHKGAVNSQAALDWISANFEAPEQIFVTGCSAGSYGSIMWTPHLKALYPESKVEQLGDSGAGIITPDWFQESFSIWNAEAAFPSWIPKLDPASVNLTDKTLGYFYEEIGAYYPDIWLSQYNTAYDSTQVTYFQYMGGGYAEDWSAAMFQSVHDIQSSTDNFRYYTAAGDRHCIIVDNAYYEVTTEGVSLPSWVDDLASHSPADSIECAGDNCFDGM